MKNKQEKGNALLDYSIVVLSGAILILITFLMPQLYSRWMDRKDLNQPHVVERETFNFKNPVSMTVNERVQQMMENLDGREGVRRTLYLNDQDVMDGELIEGIREAMEIAAQYHLMPDFSAYDIEHHIIEAEYYNLTDNTEDSTELAFWNLRFSDYATFDLLLRVDASDYIIYQAEFYCAEAEADVLEITSLDWEVISYQNTLFAEGSEAYFEGEGYDILTEMTNSELLMQMGYERGEYMLYRSTANNGHLDGTGIRWGFVPMTVALERGSSLREWGYGGIESYFYIRYGIDIYGDDENNSFLTE
ncbi:MAG: hypothetical protein J1E65_06335 [Lachnospiraceae bacterium]|nr:hypothetical protein [Lachnospiraceae bacterium]